MNFSRSLVWPVGLLLYVLTLPAALSAAGTGLLGEYFDNKDLTVLKSTRIDPFVNFNWGSKSPDPSMAPDTFSIRWSGQVEAKFSEVYKFYTFTDDGVRLWVNGQLIINQWIDQKKENIGTLALVAGQRYNIKMEFYENGAGALAQLSWSSPSQPKQIIPTSQLYTSAVAPQPASTTLTSTSTTNFDWQTATPKSQGFNSSKLEIMRDVLATRSTNALLIIRNDRIVTEWYAPGFSRTKRHSVASAAKGLAGGMALALALNDGRIKTDDLASKYIAKWRTDPVKSKIRIKHLAAHMSGVEDADGPEQWKQDFWQRIPDPFSVAINQAPIMFPPGSNFAYSNPGIAALGYSVTASIKGTTQSDIRSLLQKRIMEPIGVPASEWTMGYGTTYSLDGLKLQATWGGASYSAGAVAKVGRLVLRKGNWEGKQLIASAWATQMVTPVDKRFHAALCWFTNSLSDWRALPRDAFATAGSGHNLLLVIPSLKLIVVRLGHRLMSEEDFWLGLEEFLFEPLMNAMS